MLREGQQEDGFQKINDQLAFSLGGYYSAENGFFRNDSTGRKADDSHEAGAKARLVYQPSKRLSLDLQVNYNYTDQGAYPYYYTGKAPSSKSSEPYPQYINKLTSNRNNNYRRNSLTSGLAAGYKFKKGTLSSELHGSFCKTEWLWTKIFSQLTFILWDKCSEATHLAKK